MEKSAQRRGIINKLHEYFSPSGNAAENFFNPQFKQVMMELRLSDDNIRSIANGTKIGDFGDPGKFKISLKDLIKQAKSSLNRREYMNAAAALDKFHFKIDEISQVLNEFDKSVDKVHDDFLFGGVSEENKQVLHDMKSRHAATAYPEFRKDAGILDFLHNISTKPGRAKALWEKRYPAKTESLKKETAKLISESEVLLQNVLTSLKAMASYRSSRDVDEYVKSYEVIRSGFKVYDAKYKTWYKDQIKGFLEKVELVKPPTAEQMKEDQAPDTVKTGPNSEMNKQDLPATMRDGNGHVIPGADPTTKRDGNGNVISPPSSNLPFDLIPKTVNDLDKTMTFSFLDPSTKVPSTFDEPDPSTQVPSTKTSPPGPMSSNPPSSPQYVFRNSPSARPDMHTIPSAGIDIPAAAPPGAVLHRQMTMPFSVQTPANSNGRPHNTMMGVAPPANAPPMYSPPPTQSGVRTKMSPEEMRAFEQQHGIQSEAHKRFYETLESMAGESPIILSAFIKRYAKKIEATDPSTSIQLLKVAIRIKE